MRVKRTSVRRELKTTDNIREMEPWQIVGERRNQLDLKQGDLAHRLGYPNKNLISMIENGECKVPINRVPSVARTLGVPEVWFYESVLRCASDMEELYEFLFGKFGKLRAAYEEDISVVESGYAVERKGGLTIPDDGRSRRSSILSAA